MAKVELKQPIVEEIANNIKDAQAVVLVDYSGLTVEQDTILRKELRESGVQYKVYKNTLMRRAFEGTPCADLDKHLHGTNAIAISATDATAPARILAKFAKQYPALELVAGIVEGNYNDQAGIQALSQIPSREELLGKLLGSIQSPITNFARVLNQIAEQKGGEAEAPEEFGVSAAAGVVVAAAGAGEAAEEKDEFDVELTEVGPNKVKVIKVVREITGLGLKEAKEVVDGAPKMVKEGASKAEAEDIKTKLEAEGAKVTLK